MELYGRKTGLFHDLRIRPLGDDPGSDSFQVQVRQRVREVDGPWRYLIDVGYGVGQILPVIIELIRTDAPQMLLLQQPEVHLHPSAQAGLGSILCDVASSGRRILVETHSDHLINRVRMDVRDRKTSLRSGDVSILYFERGGHNVRIHSVRVDDCGNVVDQPPSYREFFRHEVNRSLGIYHMRDC